MLCSTSASARKETYQLQVGRSIGHDGPREHAWQPRLQVSPLVCILTGGGTSAIMRQMTRIVYWSA